MRAEIREDRTGCRSSVAAQVRARSADGRIADVDQGTALAGDQVRGRASSAAAPELQTLLPLNPYCGPWPSHS